MISSFPNSRLGKCTSTSERSRSTAMVRPSGATCRASHAEIEPLPHTERLIQRGPTPARRWRFWTLAFLSFARAWNVFLFWQRLQPDDRSQARPSPTSRARRVLCLYRHSDHVVDRGADRRFAKRQHVGARFASCYRLARSHRVTRHHELVLSQNLLGRLDSRPQSPSQGITRECAHCRNFPGASLVWISPARIHLPVSRRI